LNGSTFSSFVDQPRPTTLSPVGDVAKPWSVSKESADAARLPQHMGRVRPHLVDLTAAAHNSASGTRNQVFGRLDRTLAIQAGFEVAAVQKAAPGALPTLGHKAVSVHEAPYPSLLERPQRLIQPNYRMPVLGRGREQVVDQVLLGGPGDLAFELSDRFLYLMHVGVHRQSQGAYYSATQTVRKEVLKLARGFHWAGEDQVVELALFGQLIH
jgi:hypothetical protein